jgi:nucleoside-diphosphate-sugar epimerase
LTKNVFITGGLGQDGQILINLLKKKKINLTILYKKKKPKNLGKVNFIKNNLLNKKKLDMLFAKVKPDIVVHLAANNPSYREKNYKIFFKENFIATKNIFDSTFDTNKKVKFIFCSSSQIFKKKVGLVSEKSKKVITTDYTNFRIKSDSLMLKYKKMKKIHYTNAILFNHDSKYRNKKFLLPRIIHAIIKKDLIFLRNIKNANIHADFSHAEDICRGLLKLMFGSINLDKIIFSSGKNTSINKIIQYVIKKNKLKIDINFDENKNKKTLVGNNSFSKNKLKWSPKKNIFIAANEIYKFKVSKLK